MLKILFLWISLFYIKNIKYLMNDLFSNFGRIQKNDPEFHEIFKNFAFNEVFEYSSLSEKDSILVMLASLIAAQSPKAFKKYCSPLWIMVLHLKKSRNFCIRRFLMSVLQGHIIFLEWSLRFLTKKE